MSVSEAASLGVAKAWLRERLTEGAHCPCCTQRAQVYRRSINSGMARSLITMWRVGGKDWQHVPTTVGGQSREEGKLRYWQLVEEATEERPDGGRAGFWRVTEVGRQFALGSIALPRWALIYDGRLLALDGRERRDIHAALGSKFSLEALLGGEG